MKKNIKVLAIIICAIIFCVLTGIIRVVLVLDRADHSPISGALVEDIGCPNIGGVVKKNNFSTFKGIVIFRPFFSSCSIKIKKEGYHINGSNLLSSLPGLLGVKIVELNKIQNPQFLVKFERTFLPNTGMNMLYYINNPNNNLGSETTLNKGENDFIIVPTGKGVSPYVINGETHYMVNGDSIYKIKFNGKGGIQAISKKKEGYQGALDSYFYSLENLLIAPDSGYVQELDLSDDRGYVARLSDGKHYMVFRMNGLKMTAYIQPMESKNLESINKGLNDW